VFQMFDYQAGGISLVLIAFLEVVGIGWFYGELVHWIPPRHKRFPLFTNVIPILLPILLPTQIQ